MRFLPLVENEVLKLLKRRRFRVVLLILVALVGLIVFAQVKGRERLLSGKDWRIQVQERVAGMQNALRSGRMPKTAERWTRFEMARLQYYVDRNVDPYAITGPLFVRAFASPLITARAAAIASMMSVLPCRRRTCRLGRSTSRSSTPASSRNRVSPTP